MSDTDIFPPTGSNIMEHMSRHQQKSWTRIGVYTESVLATLIMTSHFGQPYSSYQILHQYGITIWYKLLLYCVYRNCHWTLVAIFVTSEHYIALRMDTLSKEIDEATTSIIQHLQWATELGRTKGQPIQRKQHILINITVPPSLH